jgi:hypothetical protein
MYKFGAFDKLSITHFSKLPLLAIDTAVLPS